MIEYQRALVTSAEPNLRVGRVCCGISVYTRTPSFSNAISAVKSLMKKVIFWDTLEIIAGRNWPVMHATELSFTKHL